MPVVTSGVDKNGKPLCWGMDGYLKDNMDRAIKRVKKGWDYVAIVSGLPGSGKSQFAQGLARYCCPTFDENYIAFSAEDFITLTNNCPEYSSIVLDESFQSLNSKVGMSSDFLRIINHLQLVRQKHLFIFLCLPNFFDLSKGVAIFRASHLFIAYDVDDVRGSFIAFDRDGKRKLFIKGSKFLDYNAQPSNFHGKFRKCGAIDEEVYEKLKREHLMAQDERLRHEDSKLDKRTYIYYYLIEKEGWDMKRLINASKLDQSNVYRILAKWRDAPKFRAIVDPGT